MNPTDPEVSDTGLDGEERTLDRRELLGLGAAGLLAVPLLGSGVDLAAAAGRMDEAVSGSVRFLMAENFWANWEPYQNTAQSQFRINEQIYDHLVEFPTGDISRPTPGLATSWRRVDARTWEFELRRGVRFHDGQRFTARDVKASIELASGATKKETVDAGLFWVPTGVQVVDDYTVRLRPRKPFGALFSSLQHTHIVSAEDLAGSTADLRKRPNGTGAFRLVEETPTRKTMAANGGYWRGTPRIGTLVWEFVQDPQTRLNALLAGQAHAIDRVPPEHRAIIQRSDKLALKSVTGIETVNLWARPGRLPIWQENASFRRAVNWSVNRSALVRNLVQGHAAVARSPIPRGTLYYRPQAPAYGLNVARARAELRAGGVTDGGPEFELWVARGFLPRAPEVVRVDRRRHAPGRPQAEGRHVGRRRAGQRHLQREGHRSPVPHQLVQQRRPDDRIPGLQPGVRVVLGRQDGRASGRRRSERDEPGGPPADLRTTPGAAVAAGLARPALQQRLHGGAHTRTCRALRVLKNFSTHFHPARLT